MTSASTTNRRQSLPDYESSGSDIHCLGINAALEQGVEMLLVAYEVHWGMQQLLQFFLHMHHQEQVRWHVNDNIDVTGAGRFAARHRSENAEPGDAIFCCQFRLMFA